MLVLCREGGEGGGQEVESLVADLRHDLADMRRERDRYRHLCLACSVVVCGTATRSCAPFLVSCIRARGVCSCGYVCVGFCSS